jgi:hypothetical protein
VPLRMLTNLRLAELASAHCAIEIRRQKSAARPIPTALDVSVAFGSEQLNAAVYCVQRNGASASIHDIITERRECQH